jgi:hypothetical protein
LKVPELYHFVTDWTFRAPLEKVWSVVLDIEHYAGRWKNFRRVQVLSGDGRSVGSRIDWDVATTNPILNLAAPLAKSMLARNHDQVMANGYAALRPHVEG